MFTRLEEFLRKMAKELGDSSEMSFGRADGETLEAFQLEISKLEQYEYDGLLDIVGEPHKQSRSGREYVDSIRIHLTHEGVKEWGREA